MLERFADDAELVFDGGATGRFAGVGAIRSAYVEHPPGDEVVLLEAWETAEGASGAFAWAREPDLPVGEVRLAVVDGRITRLVVTSS